MKKPLLLYPTHRFPPSLYYLARLRTKVAVQFDLDVPEGRVEGDRHYDQTQNPEENPE